MKTNAKIVVFLTVMPFANALPCACKDLDAHKPLVYLSFMPLDFTSFQKALTSLKVALTRAQLAHDDAELRDACIQRFEYTYELAYKMLLRCLKTISANPTQIDGLAFRDCLRVGAESQLIANVEDWFDFRKARNQTSHAYDQDQAAEVFKILPKFVLSAEDLLQKLQATNQPV